MSDYIAKKRNRSNEIDMLNGPLLKKILLFALPLAASSLLQELFNSVDVAVVGHFVGSEALAAVGSNAPVIGLLINLFVGVSMGACAVISKYIGQNDDEGIRKSISTVELIAAISGLFLLLLGQVAARPILTWMGTPAGVLEQAIVYLRIYFLGMPFIMAYNFGAAILRSIGDTRRPLYILIVAGVVNTLLNLLFVIGFGMGVAGVAVATGISNAVSATLIILLLTKEKEPFRLQSKRLKIHPMELNAMLHIGIPAGLQGVIFSISNVLIQSAINSFGSDAVAGSAAALNFEYYCYFIVTGFSGAAISFIAQNYGAGKIDRAHRVFLICMGCSVAVSIVLNCLFVSCDTFFLGLFSSMPGVHHYGSIRMHIVLSVHFLICSYEIAGSSMRGFGRSLTPALLTILGTCVLRVAWVYGILPIWHTYDVLMMVYPISWILTGTMVCTAYYRTLKAERHRIQNKNLSLKA